MSCGVKKQATGQMMLQKVYSHVDLIEVKYFGLQFTDNYNNNVSLRTLRLVITVIEGQIPSVYYGTDAVMCYSLSRGFF